MKEQNPILIETVPAAKELRNVPGFDPRKFLRRTAAKTGETALKLDLPYKRLWFRLACPDGRMLLNPLRITDQMAIFEARLYAGRDDASLISSFTATQTAKDEPEYIRAAQDEALNEALDNAGFGIQLCDMPQMPDSGEAIPDTPQEQPTPEPSAEETAPEAPAAQPPTQPPQQPEAAPAVPSQESAPQTASKVISMPAREQSPAPEPVAAPVAEAPAPEPVDTPVAEAPAPQNEGEAPADGEAAQELPRYTADMTVEAIRELMTLDEAKAIVVPLGSCAGLTLGQVAEERKASLKWYLYAKTDNIVKAGAANKTSIAKMKDGVILINNARGQLIDEQDVADALNSGKMAAAGLDVVYTEPIRADNPLLGAKNCIITPHISWAPKESRQRIMDITAENIRAFLKGQPVNVVNR